MTIGEIITQGIGLVGFFVFVLSFQCKDNRKLVFVQGIGGLAFFMHFILLGAYGGALFNLIILIRGLLFKNKEGKSYKLIIVEMLNIGAFIFSAFLSQWYIKQVILTALPCMALLIMNFFMWKENDKGIRFFQIFALSPAWLIHNIFNFTLGGILCEIFNMISVGISLIRYRNK